MPLAFKILLSSWRDTQGCPHQKPSLTQLPRTGCFGPSTKQNVLQHLTTFSPFKDLIIFVLQVRKLKLREAKTFPWGHTGRKRENLEPGSPKLLLSISRRYCLATSGEGQASREQLQGIYDEAAHLLFSNPD